MNQELSNPIVQRFLGLCEIPEIYVGMTANLVAIDITFTAPYYYTIEIDCRDLHVANKIRLQNKFILKAMEALNLAQTLIVYNGQCIQILINPRLVLKNIMITPDFNFDRLYISANPVYIVKIDNHKLLFANQAAIEANHKRPDDFIGEDMTLLNYPEELKYMIQMLQQDGKLIDYQSKAMQWYKDGEIWRRQRVNLIEEHHKITFLGCESRLAIELSREETGHFVD